MNQTQFDQFSNEILTQDVSAALPGNLSAEWLAELNAEVSMIVSLVSKDVLAFDLLEQAAPGIFGCVRKIRKHLGFTGETNKVEFFGHVQSYCVNVLFERLSRSGDFVEPAGLDNILARERTAMTSDIRELPFNCSERFFALVKTRQEQAEEQNDAD